MKKAFTLFSLGIFLLEEVVLAILFFRILPQFNIAIPFWLIFIIMLLFAIYYSITSLLIAKTQERRPVIGLASLINSKCKTVTDLIPDGYVKVGSELWLAHSLSGHIAIGNEVSIEYVKGLTLMVNIRSG